MTILPAVRGEEGGDFHVWFLPIIEPPNSETTKAGIATISSQALKERANPAIALKRIPQSCVQNFASCFLCTRNSDRSIFAEYFLRSVGGDRFEVYSGGENPSGEIHPLVLKILREAFKINTASALSKSWHTFTDIHFDFIITVCDDARERRPAFPGTPVTAHWSIADPMAVEGSEEEIYRAFLQAAFQVKRRIELFNCLPMEKLDHLQREVSTREIP